MRTARKARLRPTSQPPAPQAVSGHPRAHGSPPPAWYVADRTSTAQEPSTAELHDLATLVFGPATVPDGHTAVAAIRLAEACLSHASAVAHSGDGGLPPEQLGQILTGLNLVQSQIVRCAEHLARQVRHQLHAGRSGTAGDKTDLLVDMLLQAGERGQLAAAHLNEAQLLLGDR